MDFTDPDYWYGIVIGSAGTLAYQALRRYQRGSRVPQKAANYRCLQFKRDEQGTYCTKRKLGGQMQTRKRRGDRWRS